MPRAKTTSSVLFSRPRQQKTDYSRRCSRGRAPSPINSSSPSQNSSFCQLPPLAPAQSSPKNSSDLLDFEQKVPTRATEKFIQDYEVILKNEGLDSSRYSDVSQKWVQSMQQQLGLGYLETIKANFICKQHMLRPENYRETSSWRDDIESRAENLIQEYIEYEQEHKTNILKTIQDWKQNPEIFLELKPLIPKPLVPKFRNICEPHRSRSPVLVKNLEKDYDNNAFKNIEHCDWLYRNIIAEVTDETSENHIITNEWMQSDRMKCNFRWENKFRLQPMMEQDPVDEEDYSDASDSEELIKTDLNLFDKMFSEIKQQEKPQKLVIDEIMREQYGSEPVKKKIVHPEIEKIKATPLFPKIGGTPYKTPVKGAPMEMDDIIHEEDDMFLNESVCETVEHPLIKEWGFDKLDDESRKEALATRLLEILEKQKCAKSGGQSLFAQLYSGKEASFKENSFKIQNIVEFPIEELFESQQDEFSTQTQVKVVLLKADQEQWELEDKMIQYLGFHPDYPQAFFPGTELFYNESGKLKSAKDAALIKRFDPLIGIKEKEYDFECKLHTDCRCKSLFELEPQGDMLWQGFCTVFEQGSVSYEKTALVRLLRDSEGFVSIWGVSRPFNECWNSKRALNLKICGRIDQQITRVYMLPFQEFQQSRNIMIENLNSKTFRLYFGDAERADSFIKIF